MTVLCGVEQVNKTPLEPYSQLVCDFLAEYSGALRKDPEAKQYPDVMTFAFWGRRANILQRKQEFENRYGNRIRLGKGMVFHIAPSNVPVNFMFSYAFGLLAGNANVVRVPGKPFPQVDCMCRILEEVLKQENYGKLHAMTSIVRYERDKEVTDKWSGLCNMRVIWGGDDTILDIRKSELPPRSTELTFADRYSFGMINTRALLESSPSQMHQLAEDFYKDTYLMDQNACSTPHLICWTLEGVSEAEWKTIQGAFWNQVKEVANQYELADIKVSEKYSLLCEKVMENNSIGTVTRYDNLLYVCDVMTLTEDTVTELRGRYGLFFQYPLNTLEELQVLSKEKVQTCAYYGMDAVMLAGFMKEQGYCGVDRIVPFGKTLDLDVVWDGYDLVAEMSRIIAVE